MGAGPERLLDFVALRDEGDLRLRSAAFLRFLLLHLTVRDTIRYLEGEGELRAVWALCSAVCLAASFHAPALRAAAWGGLAVGTWKWITIFPDNSNHFFLEYLCLLLASLASFRRDEDLLVFVRGVRWIPVLVLFWSGVNKALYGTYWNGAYLGTILPHSGFAFVFGLLMSNEELSRLLAATPPGPYAFSSPLALLASNAVWLLEIVSAVLLMVPRLRGLGAAIGLALLVGIELGARELMFGVLMTNMLAFFAPAVWSRRLLPASAAFYAVLVASRAGLLPSWSFN